MKEFILIGTLVMSLVSLAEGTDLMKPGEGAPQTQLINVEHIIRTALVFDGDEVLGYRLFPGLDAKQFWALGLSVGDIIVEIDGAALTDPKQALQEIEKLGTGDPVSVVVERDGLREVLVLILQPAQIKDDPYVVSQKSLFEAARDGDVERVQELIDAGADVNDTTAGHGMSALAIAIDKADRDLGQVAVVELLISHGADLSTRDWMGRTLLVYALTKGSPVVKALLDAGIEVNAQDDLGATALSNAVINQDDEVFDLLLRYGADVKLLSDGGSIALQSAIANKHFDRVLRLLDLGIDINARSSDGETVLFAVLDEHRSPRANEVQVLLERGAVVNIEDHYGNSPLKLAKKNLEEFLATEKSAMRAAKSGKLFSTTPEMLQRDKRDYQQIVALLEAVGAKEQVPAEMNLLYAARIADLDRVRKYLAAGEDVDAVDSKNGYTALMWSLSQDHHEVAKILLDNGADPNVIGNRGEESALAMAVERNAPVELIVNLLDSGADPNLALGTAVLYAPTTVVKLMLDRGADPNFKTSEDDYPIAYFAMMAGREDVLALLIAAGAE